MWSDDPLRDFQNHDLEESDRLKMRPVCYECGEPITEDYAYRISGNMYHRDCLEHYKVNIEEE